MTAAEAEARRNDWRVAITIIEPNGALAMFKKLDGAPYSAVDVSMGKARTAAFYRRPSKNFADGLAQGNLTVLTVSNMLPAQGGAPIVVSGRIIGTIGVSSATSEQDEQVANAGVAAAAGVR